jgi:hypothetical protein
VEITDAEAFAARLRASIECPASQLKLVQGPVRYYELADAPGVDWALPEVMLFGKHCFYARQQEYRFAFGHAEVFDLSGTLGGHPKPAIDGHLKTGH